MDVPFTDVLWPAGGTGTSRFLPIVRDGVVRSLIPADQPRLARRALLRSNGPESRGRRVARRGYAELSRGLLGVGRRSLVEVSGTGLRDRLADVAGRPVHLAIHFGPPRANRKPVVHALDDNGELVAVAKLAINGLTNRLIRNETRALHHLCSQDLAPMLSHPRVLSAESWATATMLVQSPVPIVGAHSIPRRSERSAAELALGRTTRRTGGTDYLEGLRQRLGALRGTSELSTRADGETTLVPALDDLLSRFPPEEIAVGASHGDWSAQNVARGPRGVVAWDWERYSEARPLGYDTAHFRFQHLLNDSRVPQPGVILVREAPTILEPWRQGVDPERSRHVVGLVLLDLAARYLGDGQVGTGSPGSRTLSWIAPALHELTR